MQTRPEEVAALCQQVWDNELKGGDVRNKEFLAEVEKAMKALPGRKAPAAARQCPLCGKPVKPIVLQAHKLECTGDQ